MFELEGLRGGDWWCDCDGWIDVIRGVLRSSPRILGELKGPLERFSFEA